MKANKANFPPSKGVEQKSDAGCLSSEDDGRKIGWMMDDSSLVLSAFGPFDSAQGQASLLCPLSPGEKRKNRSEYQLINEMKQRFDSDLSTTIKDLCCRSVVDTYSCNDQTVCIDGSADIIDFGVLYFCTVGLAQSIITGAKRNGFDNFTGDSLSHSITPTTTILANFSKIIKENLAELNDNRPIPLYVYCDAVHGRTILLDKKRNL